STPLFRSDVAHHVELLVDVDHHANARPERLLHGFHAAAVHGGIRVVDLHLVVAAAHGRVALGLGNEILLRVLAPAAAAVAGDAIAYGTPESVEGKARRLAREVPQRDVDRRDRHAGEPHAAHAPVAAVHLLPQALDRERVLADEKRREALLQVRMHALRAAAAEHQAVAHALQ